THEGLGDEGAGEEGDEDRVEADLPAEEAEDRPGPDRDGQAKGQLLGRERGDRRALDEAALAAAEPDRPLHRALRADGLVAAAAADVRLALRVAIAVERAGIAVDGHGPRIRGHGPQGRRPKVPRQ